MTKPMTAQQLPPIEGLPRVGHGSLTEQTAEALLQAVLSNTFPAERLPAEPELARQMGVSRTTIRAALQSLERLGVISRTRGRGTLVRPHVGRDAMLLERIVGFRGMLSARFDDVQVRQAFTIREFGSAEATAALKIAPDTRMLVEEKTFVADGRPVAHLFSEVPLHFVADGMAEQLVERRVELPATIFDFSDSWPGRKIDHSIVEFVPMVAPKRLPANFPLPLRPGSPYLEMRESHYSETNEPIAYTQQFFDDEIVRIKVARPIW